MALTRRNYLEAISGAEPFDGNPNFGSPQIAVRFWRRNIRLIIVNVAAYDYTRSSLRGIPHNLRPPIGLFSLRAAVCACDEEFSESVYMVDMERERLAPEDMAVLVAEAQALSQFRIIVGINGYSPNRAIVEKVASAIRLLSPGSRLLLGGRLISIELDPRTHSSISPAESLLANVAQSAETLALVGEGERLLPWLLNLKHWSHQEICNEPSMAWGFRNELRLPSKFESLPAEWLSKLDYSPPKYIATAGGDHEYYAMLSSRSCPFHCSFCAANYFPVRVLPISFVERQIRSLSGTNRPVRIDFCDDNVLMTEKRSREFIEMMERLHDEGIPVVWRALARGDSILRLHKKGYIERAAAVGLEEVAIGLETTSDRLLKRMSKELEFAEVNSAIESLGNAMIRAKMFAIVGIPTETEAEATGTIRYLLDRAEQGHRWSLFVQAPYAGTEDHRSLLAAGWTYWDLQLYTEAASRGGALIDAVDKAGIRLANSTLSELYALVEEVTGSCSYKDGGGEDCCAASCDDASRQMASVQPNGT
jgi:MoaA/NifB/PqqE/SkfB family radical SAM enzyme